MNQRFSTWVQKGIKGQTIISSLSGKKSKHQHEVFSLPVFLWNNRDCYFVGSAEGNRRPPHVKTSEEIFLEIFKI